MRHTTLATLCFLALASCSTSTGHEHVEAREPIHHPEYGLITAQPVEGWDVFGADVPERAPLTMEQLVAEADRHAGKDVVVEGTIGAVCPKKGCWMRFDANGEEVFVKFQDYAFFMPKDSAGRTARLFGRFEVQEMPAEEAQHYLEDAGKHDEAAKITGPVKTYKVLARGVRIAE